MKRWKHFKKYINAGFTLAEMLITVAILSILGAVITVSAVQMVRNMRQASSDKVAESLYTAVTAHLQEVYAFHYENVATLDTSDVAIGATEESAAKLCYVAKNPDTPVTGDVQQIVLGIDGSAIGADYAGDSIIVEYNPSSLQVYSVFYSSEVLPSSYYTSSGSAENTLADLRSDVSKRKSEFKGYLGYYQADTQDLPELNENEYAVMVGLPSTHTGDPERHLRNLDELNAPVSVHIPYEEVSKIGKLKFEITVTGKKSKASAKIVYDEQEPANHGTLSSVLKQSDIYSTTAQMVSFEVVLDNLEEGTFQQHFCSNTPGTSKSDTIIRFYGKTVGTNTTILSKKVPITLIPNESGDLFVPGEDIEVHVSAIKVDGVEMDIRDDSKNSATDNSLFAYGSGKKTESGDAFFATYLAYGRHLQNLSTETNGMDSSLFSDSLAIELPIKAYQVDNIDFTRDAKDYAENHNWLWCDLYAGSKDKPYDYEQQKPFQPIVNSGVKVLRGDYKLQYDAGTSSLYANTDRAEGYVGSTTYAINGIVVRSTAGKTISKAGVFGEFSGNEIRNVTLTNPRFSGDGVTGGFIASAALKHGETLTIENCALYMTDEYYAEYEDANPYGIVEKGGDAETRDDADVTGIWMSGKTYAGGLIGQFCYDKTDAAGGATPQLAINHSHASTVIDTTGTDGKTGGLVGYVGTDGSDEALSVSLESCYADSYLSGADTGGLIGRIASDQTVDMNHVYTAGFQNGSIQAGFANGTIHSVKASYAFTQMNIDKNARAFTTAAKITTANKVYYFPQNSANSGNAGRITDADNTINVEELAKESQTKTIAELLLEKLGSAFEKDPGDTGAYNLREGMALSTYTKPRLKDLVHYGDWEEEFMPGALVYYEKYVKDGSKVRFYGGNYNALYDSLEEGEAVRADGYGLVFKKNDKDHVIPDSLEIKYHFSGANGTPESETITLKDVTPLEAEYGEQTYLIYPLGTEKVNHVLTKESSFYTKVEVTYQKEGSTDNTEVYYFNPHFARAVGYLGSGAEGAALPVPELKTNGVIYVRSARHLYNLSLYYKYYRTATEGRTFRQTYDISYKDYDWNGYFNAAIPAGNCITRQNPIGLTSGDTGDSFIAKYNGGCFQIRDVSFVLEAEKNGVAATSYYTGLFGYNEGELRNIVLFADYDESDTSAVTIGKAQTPNPENPAETIQNHYYAANNATVHYYAGTEEDIGKNKELYLGVLVGKNSGTITNCATAGYYLADASGTIIGNSNGYVYAGGLTGENAGTVTNSAADTPFVRLTTNYSTAFLAGFAGRNTGRILNSYALGHIEVVNPRGGSITLAGFSAKNSGELSSCYAAVNIQSSGNAKVYGFSPQGGMVSGCNYLHKGTFAYVGHLYSYTYLNDQGAGTAKTRDDLINEANTTTKVKPGITKDYPKYIKDQVEKDYPYRAVVTDASGAYIHYGDWQRVPQLGKYGVFYWEKEENGGNAGYHFSFVGVDEQFDVAGSSLCNAHDDSGLIVDYGYGYYVSVGTESTVTIDRTLSKGLHIPDNHLTDVAAELHKEAPDYTFYPYRTLPNNAADKSSYLYLDYSAEEVASGHWTGDETNKDIRNGLWVLKKDQAEKGFYVAPFFANAMSLQDPKETTLIVNSQDGVNKTDYVKKPGTTENPYEIRTVEQLQYINWNAAYQNVSTLVEADNYKTFPYLAYASVTTKGKQKKADAGHNESQKFLQTHDVSGLNKNGDAVIPNYTPIAASHTASSLSGYTAILYAWFGSDYDGQSYKITNINISSPAFSVGVFGVTASAGLENIILYSDKDSVIQRNNGSNMTPGGYSLGGLVGIAYKYADAAAGTGAIKNCAVAGYRIIDNSTNQQTQGESNVGGLIGATRVDVKNCSAVTDIEINCTHQNGHSTWGDYVRVGGLVGALPGTAINCYSGGSIKVGDATLAESVDTSGNVIPLGDGEEDRICDRARSMNLYIAGMAGSAFSMNYQNFTDKSKEDDASPTLRNCYCYVDFPEMKGSIRSITMIASLADRYGNDSASDKLRVNLTNCLYLKKYDQSKVQNAAKYTIKSDNGHTGAISPYTALTATTNFDYNNGDPANETFFANMIRGGGAYCSKVTGYNNGRIKSSNTLDIDVEPSPLSFEQLSGTAAGITVWDASSHSMATRGDGKILDALNYGGEGTFGWVTTTLPSGARIDGKYSFPGNNKTLDGLNYLFPTIVTQRDIVFNRTVNVHYGWWPLNGMYWSEARSEMDIFGDKAANEDFAYKTLQVLDAGSVDLTDLSHFDMEPNDIVAIDSVTATATAGVFDVRFKALKTGTVTVTVDNTATLVLEVKANFSVATDPSKVEVPSARYTTVDDATKQLTLYANAVSTPDPTTGATTNVDYSMKAAWTVTIQGSAPDYVGYIDRDNTKHDETLAAGTNTCEITGDNPGKTQIVAKAVLTYNGEFYESSVYLPLQTLGVVGLSDHGLSTATDTNGFWNETCRAASGSINGANKDYSGAAQMPQMTEDKWTDLYLYETYADESLGSMKITGIKIDNQEISNVIDDGEHKTYTSGVYTIDIGSAAEKISTDGKYRYRSLKLRPADGNKGDSIPVEITVKDGETEASYVLSGTLHATHIVTFHSNEPATASEKATLPLQSLHANGNGTVDLSGNDKLPTMTGYKFIGWATAPDGTATYCTGDAHTENTSIANFTNDADLYAKWTPISYTIKFNPGNGTYKTAGENLPDIPAKYDEGKRLPTKEDAESKYNPPTTSSGQTSAAPMMSSAAPEASSTSTPEAGSGAAPEASSTSTPEAGSGTTPATSSLSAPAATVSAIPSVITGSAPETTPPAAPETTPAAAPETTPETTPEATPGTSQETTPNAAPETGSGSTPSADPTADPTNDPAAETETPLLGAPARGLLGAPANTSNFVGWNTAKDGSGISYKPGANVKNLTTTDGAEVILYAQWREYFKLTFVDYKDGSVDEKKQVNNSAGASTYQVQSAQLPNSVVWKQVNNTWGYYWSSASGTTYHFLGWDTDRKATSASYAVGVDGSGNPTLPLITGIEWDTTYYAIWEEVTYTITLIDTLTGTPTTNTYDHLSGGLKSLKDITGYTAPSHDGYTFVGWYTDRIANGGDRFADSSSDLKDGKTLEALLSTTAGGSVTLYARYSTEIYVAKKDENGKQSLKDKNDYLVTITELGNSVKPYNGQFAYLLTNNTTGCYPRAETSDLAAVDHTFRNADTHGKFYSEEAGTAAKVLGSVVYMDTKSMPMNIYNIIRDSQKTNPIGMDIPSNAVWTWHTTDAQKGEGQFEMKNTPGEYLYAETPAHVKTGSSAPADPNQRIWQYIPKTGYCLLQSKYNNYYLCSNYWNMFLNNQSSATDEGGTPPNNRSYRVTFYEKTKVYLDESVSPP